MIPFTPEEKTIIAEFVYALGTDTLIITEVKDLIQTLHTHNLIEHKEEWINRITVKDSTVVSELSTILHNKISSEQGISIMDEYYGVKRKDSTNSKESEKMEQESQQQLYCWGVGKETNAKAFDTVKIHGDDYELIFGEYPHSRRDENIYARSKENPESIYGFDGHRIPFKIVIEESNYIKHSGLSGNEVRKACSGKLFLNDKQIFECGGRNYGRAYKNIERFIDDMEENWSWYPNKTEEWLGKLIKYEGQIFKIKNFIISQACMMLETPDGKPRKPFASEAEEVEEGDFDGTDSLKVEITDKNIWWYPTEKEMEKYQVKN